MKNLILESPSHACAELGRRLHSGIPAKVEDFLFPSIAEDPNNIIDLIYEEFSTRLDVFKHKLINELIARFPHLRTQLENQFAVHDAMMDTVCDQLLIPTVSIPSADQFDLYHEIGRGRQSIVYFAWDLRRGLAVALKVFSGTSRGLSSDVKRRLLSEGEMLAKIRHPNVVALLDIGDRDGSPYLVLEYVDGDSLRSLLTGAMPVTKSLKIVQSLADALAAIHGHGIVHRDLSPANVLLRTDGVPKIADFGLAQLFSNTAGKPDNLAGTPSYMAPEHLTGSEGAIGPRSDIYSLGAIFYEMLTGRPPFLAETVHGTFQRILTEPVTPPRQIVSSIPESIERICLKCLEKDPVRRYGNAKALGMDLGRVQIR